MRPALLLFLILSLGACAAPVPILNAGVNVAQSGTAAFFGGELEFALAHPIDDVNAAVLATGNDLGYTVKQRNSSFSVRSVTLKPVTGNFVFVTLYSNTAVVTQVRIRVGLTGNEAVSRLILREIEGRLLKSNATTPAPEATVQPC